MDSLFVAMMSINKVIVIEELCERYCRNGIS